MYTMYQAVKPNGDKMAWLDLETALDEVKKLSKNAGNQQVVYYELECQEEDSDTNPGEEMVIHTKVYQNGEVISANNDRYPPPMVVVPGGKPKKTKQAKQGLSAEEKAAKDAEKAAAKAKKDEEKAARAAERALAKEERDKLRAEAKAKREAEKANRPPRGSRSKLPEDGLIHILSTSNPKREGSASRERFDWYVEGMTVKAYKEKNTDYGSLDLAWDIDHGFIKVTNADGSELAVPVPITASEPVPLTPTGSESPAEEASPHA